MTDYKVGDRVRVTDISGQSQSGLTVGDTGTVSDVLTEPKSFIQALYGDDQPLFVTVDGKPCVHAFEPDNTDWPLLSSEVEPVAEEDAA